MQRIVNLLERGIVPILIGIIVFIIGILFSNGVMGGGDSFAHFLIAKYSWKHAYLFFDHWGKPLFTILASPFAQFGLQGIVWFNVLCGIVSTYTTYQILKQEKLPGIAAMALLLTPYFASIHVSGLTEPLFTTILIALIYMHLRKAWVWAALLAGSLLFVRTEGVLFAGLLGLQLLFQKQYRALLCLFLPFVVFSLAGSPFYKGNVFWFTNEVPYAVQSFYEQGSLLHFVTQSDIIFGLPLLIFGLLGIGFTLFYKQKYQRYILPLVVYPLVYFVFHSALFGFGLGASAGLKRVMIVLTPALCVLAGIAVMRLKEIHPVLEKSLLPVFTVFVLVSYGSSSRMPVYQNKQEQLMKQVASQLQDKQPNRVFYFHPAYPVYAECDPFAKTNCIEGKPASYRQGDIVIWDSHFAPNEGNMQLEELMSDQRFTPIIDVEDSDRVVAFQYTKEH